MSCLLWLAGGVVLGVVFDETFRAVWKRVRTKGEEVVNKVRD